MSYTRTVYENLLNNIKTNGLSKYMSFWGWILEIKTNLICLLQFASNVEEEDVLNWVLL